MKKILFSVLFLLVACLFSVPTKAQANKAKATTAQNEQKGKLKKDGTPDMRYKENKDASKTAKKHLKKDGTPDKRYKENKK